MARGRDGEGRCPFMAGAIKTPLVAGDDLSIDVASPSSGEEERAASCANDLFIPCVILIIWPTTINNEIDQMQCRGKEMKRNLLKSILFMMGHWIAIFGHQNTNLFNAHHTTNSPPPPPNTII